MRIRVGTHGDSLTLPHLLTHSLAFKKFACGPVKAGRHVSYVYTSKRRLNILASNFSTELMSGVTSKQRERARERILDDDYYLHCYTDNTTDTATTSARCMQSLDVAHDELHEEHVTQHLLATRQSGTHTLYYYWGLHYSPCICCCC